MQVSRVDRISKKTRSAVMSKIRSTGNKSTELRLRMAFIREGIQGWTMHPRSIFGKPDFWFPVARIAVFVDGCFWHGCQRVGCSRSPQQNREYWIKKIARNVCRAQEVTMALGRQGCKAMRVWEHQLATVEGVRQTVRSIACQLVREDRAPNHGFDKR